MKSKITAFEWARRLFPAVLVVAIFALGVSGVKAKTSSESANYHEDAKSFLEKGDPGSAIIQFKNAIRADPNNFQARFDLAVIYLRGRNGPAAEKELKAARDRGMDKDEIWLPLARAYALQRKYEVILDEIIPDIQTGQLKANMLAARGAAHAALKQFDRAEKALDQAVLEAPDSPFVLLAFSQVLQARGKFEEAEARIDQVLTIEPENQRALLRKGAMQQTRKDYAGAVESFGKAIAYNESNIAAWLARASGYIAMNDDARARADVAVVRERARNNPIAQYLSALLLAREKKFREAVDILQPVQQVLSGYPPALYLAASLDFAVGRIEQAQSNIQSYLAKVPKSPRGLRLLAAVHMRKRAPGRAIEILEPMTLATPDNVNMLTMLGNAYVAIGRNAEATVLFEKVARTDPENYAARTRLALTQLNSGDRDAAEKEFESILADDPDETQANLLLVLMHLRGRSYDLALKSALSLKQRMPKSPIPENFLGTIYLGQKDVEKARGHFAKALEIQPDFSPATLNIAEIDWVAGNFDAARDRYKEVLARDKKHLQAMMRLAQLAFTQNDADTGYDWLRRAIAENPKSTRPRLALVNAFLQAKDSRHALSTARELVQIAKKKPEALEALARAQIAAGNLTSGVSIYRQLTSLAPRSAIVYYRLARALIASNDFTAAARALDDAIERDPNLWAARQDRIAVAIQAEGLDAALRLATKMIKDAPDADFGYVLQGDVHMRDGDPVAASKAYANAQRRKPTSRTVVRLYRSQSRAKDHAGARKTLENWSLAHPDDSAIRFLYASDLIRSKEYPAAIRENELLLKKFPENAVLLNDLAWLYGETGDGRAIGLARRARDLAPDSPAIADTLGWLLVQTGEIDEGLAELKIARTGAPDQLEIGYHFAAALAKVGRNNEAMKVLREILDAGKPFDPIQEARILYAMLARK